jgi:two-component system, NarL family, sensor kinase
MKFFSRYYTCLLLMVTSLHSRGQELMNMDSLLRTLTTAKEDTNKVLLYISIGQQYENNQPESAAHYYTQAKLLSEKLNYTIGIIKYISNITYVLNLQGRLDSSLQLNLYSVELARKINDKRREAFGLANAGTSYLDMEQYENAASYFLQAIKMLEELDLKQNLGVLYNNLAILYHKMMQYDKSIGYAKDAISISRSLNDSINLCISLNTISLPLISKNKPAEALPYLQEAGVISRLTNNIYVRESCLLNLGTVYMMTGELEKQLASGTEALELSRGLEDKEGIAVSYRLLSDYYLAKLQLGKAKENALQSLEVARASGQLVNEKKALLLLSDIALSLHQPEEFKKYRAQQDSIDVLLLNQQITHNTQELETKYETEKKNSQISELEKDRRITILSIRQKNTLNYTLIGVVATILIISLLVYRTYRQKQLLQQKRIGELEKEKQLLATEAILKGEEDERTRLARDLHDGLGGMLSGIKYSLNTMKGNMIMTEEHVQSFERSIDMLDTSIREMRRVAHNLMPESLIKFGLDTALKDFCKDINNSGAITINYQSFGMEKRDIDQQVAIIVYRVVQELVNNIIKHAQARQAIVQLTAATEQLAITVEDDGKGFDPGKPDNKTGIGWSNIQSRIDYLKGKIDVRSHTGEGTSIHIELPL